MRRFCWRERSEKLNWRLLGALDVAEVVRRGDPAVLEPYALHVTFARLPRGAGEALDPATRDAWFLVRLLQLAMEYLLFMRARDGDVLEALGQELRQVEKERDELVLGVQRWTGRARSGDKQVDKLHQVLQNIAKLLQIHGTSPSAVATIETLLTELIAERRAKQKRRAFEKEEDGVGEAEQVQEARVCGFCGKLFSSAEYLEKHLVRRHGGERLEVETPVKNRMRRDFRDEMEDKENRARNDDSAAVEVSMQKMVQQVERALLEHEEKLQLLAEGETQKVQQAFERLHAETKLAEERKVTRLETEQQRKEVLRQLDEISLDKQNAEEKLADLKQQIQFLTLKKKMMGSSGSPASLPPNEDDALTAAKAEIRKLQDTLGVVSSELTASREELAKVHSLYLSALRKKKELADKIALQREIPAATAQQEHSSQTDNLTVVNESVQTDEQARPLLVESKALTEPSAPICVDVGTDAWRSSCEDVGIQTVDLLEAAFVDAEVQAGTDEPASTITEPVSQEAPTAQADSSEVAKEIVAVQKDEERLPDYIQQIHSQGLLERLTERAQSAASEVASNEAPWDAASRKFSSIPRHKYVRSHFQHDEEGVKERVASCLLQLEQFSSRFGVPAKSVWLPEDNLQIVQQALHGHLEVLPSEVLARMIECENTVNALIETEWMPMETARRQALERFKMEARAKAEASQGLVRQAMAAFGSSTRATPALGTSSSEAAAELISEKPNSNEIDTKVEGDPDQEVPVVTTARRFSAKNQLSVVVDEEATVEGTAYLPGALVEPRLSDSGADANVAVTDVEEAASPDEVRDTVDYLVESLQRDNEGEGKAEEPAPNALLASSLRPSHDAEDPQASVAKVDVDLPSAAETSLRSVSPTSAMKSMRVDSVTQNRRYPSLEAEARAGGYSARSSPTSIAVRPVVSAQERTSDDPPAEEHDAEQGEVPQWHLPRVGSSSDLGAPQRTPVDHVLSRTRPDHLEAASSRQPTPSLDSDRLSEASQLEMVDPPPRLERTQSILASSELSFGPDIPSLGVASESVEASTAAVVLGLIDAVDQTHEQHGEAGAAPAASSSDRCAPNDSVLSFDDSDIEEVVLT